MYLPTLNEDLLCRRERHPWKSIVNSAFRQADTKTIVSSIFRLIKCIFQLDLNPNYRQSRVLTFGLSAYYCNSKHYRSTIQEIQGQYGKTLLADGTSTKVCTVSTLKKLKSKYFKILTSYDTKKKSKLEQRLTSKDKIGIQMSKFTCIGYLILCCLRNMIIITISYLHITLGSNNSNRTKQFQIVPTTFIEITSISQMLTPFLYAYFYE